LHRPAAARRTCTSPAAAIGTCMPSTEKSPRPSPSAARASTVPRVTAVFLLCQPLAERCAARSVHAQLHPRRTCAGTLKASVDCDRNTASICRILAAATARPVSRLTDSGAHQTLARDGGRTPVAPCRSKGDRCEIRYSFRSRLNLLLDSRTTSGLKNWPRKLAAIQRAVPVLLWRGGRSIPHPDWR